MEPPDYSVDFRPLRASLQPPSVIAAIVVVFIFKGTRVLFSEHARTHAFGVGRQTQLVAVGWVLFIFVFLCFVACLFCPSFLSLSFFGCPSLFLVLSGLLFAGVFFFDVCLVWLVSFFFVARCPASYKKGERGRGQSPGGYSSGFVSPSGPKDPTGTCGGHECETPTRSHDSSTRVLGQTAAADGRAEKRGSEGGSEGKSDSHDPEDSHSGAGREGESLRFGVLTQRGQIILTRSATRK